jgi:hypothetical protein
MMVSLIAAMQTRSTPDGGFVTQVRLEDQPERLALVVDEVEVRPRRAVHPLLVVGRRGHRGAHPLDQRVAMGVEQREVELELAGEVLVQHRLGDAGAHGDVVHGGGVVALGDEHVLRCGEQLLATSRPR